MDENIQLSQIFEFEEDAEIEMEDDPSELFFSELTNEEKGDWQKIPVTSKRRSTILQDLKKWILMGRM